MWPFKTEHRADATDAIVAALVSAAGGSGVAPTVETLGAVETAAGLWARSFAATTITPSTAATRALTPSVLASIGRGLAVRGETLFVLDVDETGLTLTQAARWEVKGGSRPESWRYAVEMPVPGGMVKRTYPSASVVHVRYATRPGSPWAGVSPLGMASETQALAAWLERRLAEEASTATSYVLPLPEGASVDDLKADLKAGRGKLHIVDTTAGGWGEGAAAAPRGDWQTMRLGASPPAALGGLRKDVRADVLSLYGIPAGGTGGTASRENWRQAVAGTLVPVAKLVAQELADKLDAPGLEFTFTALRDADLIAKARSFKALVDGGMDAAKAAKIAGLE